MSHTCRRHRVADSESLIDSKIQPFRVRRSSNCLQLIQGGPNKDGRALTVAEQKSVGRRFHKKRHSFRRLVLSLDADEDGISNAIRSYIDNGWFREDDEREMPRRAA